MALTAAQLAFIRGMTGDTASEMTDAELQAIYDDTEQGNSSLPTTIVWAMRQLVALALNDADNISGGELIVSASSSKYKKRKEHLVYLEGLFGSPGGQTVARTYTHARRADSRQTEAPTYDGGTDSDDED